MYLYFALLSDCNDEVKTHLYSNFCQYVAPLPSDYFALATSQVDFRLPKLHSGDMTDSAPSDRSRFYSVAELAKEFSLTSQGIRFYEESGLIAPARVGRTRVFNYQDRARLGLIQRLRRLGFSIEAIRDYLSLYKADATGAAQYRRGLERIAERIEELESKRRDLDETLA